ncbi:alcohol dehydrogenase catalytic domain-containing protein [Actinoplanes utahensis]|uniref:Alcohol dehydrogenase n=1 Tax=Actinoplanes utahensis TaxID=1869 RepID=A0A0A6X8F7_ACTUT|nr:alcohol dehydrogenase catalytic domain-containing protein [Actinoplanes utahensis]KHD76412.1 alcohol dehydrogenase [Actinoplanes utahensis]GIF29811.1 oxidoreductase [Actinoplanes utahensis]
MLAYRMTAWGAPPRTVEAPDPAPGPGETLIRVAGCGLCRSDLTMRHVPEAAGAALGWRMPFTLGHEIAGWVASTGEPVALVSPASCGACRHCLRGQDSGCPHGLTGRGYGRDGGLADHVLVDDERALLPLGDLDPRHAGPLTDAGATAMHAVRRALPRVTPGGTAVVIGAGGLGAFAVQFLRILTAATVVAVDPSPARRDHALSIGAHHATPASGTRDADVVLDFVGTDETITAGVAAVRTGGAYGLIGSAGGRLGKPWFSALPRDGEVFTFQGSSIADAQDVIGLARAGLIHNQVEEFAFGEIEQAYARLAAGSLTGRAVIVL